MSDIGHDCAKCGAILMEHIQTLACGNNCRECGRYSFLADQPSYLYLLTNNDLKLYKIGIGTFGTDRNQLQKLIQAGWIVYGLWHDHDKHKTFQWEREVFKQLHAVVTKADTQAPVFVGRRDRSWVESVNAQAISVEALTELISAICVRTVK